MSVVISNSVFFHSKTGCPHQNPFFLSLQCLQTLVSVMSSPRPPSPPQPPSPSTTNAAPIVITGIETLPESQHSTHRCRFWLSNKRRLCANAPLPSSQFCGNHDPASTHRRIPCPIDPSHFVLKENLDSHVKRCPLKAQAQALESQPFYSKGVNGGATSPNDDENVSSEGKRNAVYRLTVKEFHDLVRKIELIRCSVTDVLSDSYLVPNACEKWMKQQVDRCVPYQEKHVKQQASILGNMEAFGVLRKPDEEMMEAGCEGGIEGSDGSCRKDVNVPAVVEFGAGRGYLTHMLADCYGIMKVLLVERRSYKLKADRNLRQIQSLSLERLRIDIEDLNLHAVESLGGLQYLAIGKHLCGPATDLAIRCCLPEGCKQNRKVLSSLLQGLALATCCHHLCQWKHYINKSFLLRWGITKEEFNAITWLSSWAVDANHSFDLSRAADREIHLNTSATRESASNNGVEETIRGMQAVERAVLGFMCKEVIDIGRLLWLREQGLDAQLVKYVPSNISPENHLLLAAFSKTNTHL